MAFARHLDLWEESLFTSYQFQRVLAMCPGGGADPGECLRAASKIQPGNWESWYGTWSELAAACVTIAEESGRSAISHRDAMLRASNYWRAADFLLLPNDPRKLQCFNQSQLAFRAAISGLPYDISVVEIPLGESVMDGYLMLPRGAGSTSVPVAMFGGTIDTTAEEHFFALGFALLERGLGVLLLDGPGQGATLRLRKMAARFDYEVPIAATIDFLSRCSRIDSKRLAVIGWGGGSYYALRAASKETRIAACVSWNSAYSWDLEEWKEIAGNAADLEGIPEAAVRRPLGQSLWDEPDARRFTSHFAVWRSFAGSVQQLIEVIEKHDLTGVLHEMVCPLLVIEGEEDSPATAMKVYAESGSVDKTLKIYPAEGPGARHVQVDGITRAQADIGDWLLSKF